MGKITGEEENTNIRNFTEEENQTYLSIDQFLGHVGEMGKFQIGVLIVCSFLYVIPAHLSLHMVFTAASPPWRCSGIDLTQCNTNKTFYEGDNDFNLRCDMNRSSWEYVIERSSYSIVSEFDLICSREYLANLANSALFLGLGVCSPLVGWLSDKYGRRKVLFPCFFMQCILGFAISFSPNVYSFIVLSFICGNVYSGVSLNLIVIAVELVGPKYRAFAGLIIWEIYSVAGCLLSLQSYYIPDWRVLTKIITIPYIVFTVGYIFVPESTRWLRSKNKLKEAETILKKTAKTNKRNYPSNAALQPIHICEMENSGTFRDLFTSRQAIIKLFIVSFMWFTVDCLYYGLVLAFSGFGGSLHRDFVLMIVPEIIMNVASIFMSDRFGRKSSAIIGFVGSAVGLVIVGILTAVDVKVNSVNIIIGILVKIFSLLAWCALDIWSTELFPTCVRSKAMGISFISSTIGTSSAPWVAKAMLQFHISAPFFVLGAIPIFASLMAITIPETKGTIMDDFVVHETEQNQDENMTRL